MSEAALKEHLESLYDAFLNTGEEAKAKEFAAYVRLNADVPIHAQQLLAYKIQSPIEKEAVAGLKVLEICVRNAGKTFHNEIGKYRFLNELIRVVSPKYLGPRCSTEVKNRVIEIMYSWTIGLKEQTKIADAYSMLKKQGIVKQDPKFDERLTMPTPAPVERCTLIKDAEEEDRLSKLLNSKNPDDIALANEMIKTMYEKDNQRIERIGRKNALMAEAEEKVKLMDEMIDAGASAKSTIAQIYRELEQMRPQLFRLTSETEDNNDELMVILRLTDEVNRIINLCKDKHPDIINMQSPVSDPSSPMSNGSNDILIGIESKNGLDEQTKRLQELGLDLDLLGIGDDQPKSANSKKSGSSAKEQKSKTKPIEDLKDLNSIFMQQQFGHVSQAQSNGPSPTLLDLSTPKEIKPVNPVPPAQPVSQATEISPLTGFSFSISDFTPSSTCRTLVDENGIRVILVRGTNKIPDRDDVSVLLVTFDSTNPKPVENLIFNAKVLKPYRIKLLQPSGNEFPAFNPVATSSSRITQILLLGGRPDAIKWTLQFDIDDDQLVKEGQISL